MNFTFEQQGYVGILRFYGELTSRRESELTEALILSLDNTDYLVVNLHNASFSKCAYLVPILLARHNALKKNKSVQLIGVDNEAVKCAVHHYHQSGSEPWVQ